MFGEKFYIIKILKIAILALALNCNLAYAEWGVQSIPVLPDAKEEMKQNRTMAGLEFVFTFYSSNSNSSSIKDFYRNRLPPLGWKENDLLKNLGSLPGIKIPEQAAGMLEQNLVFEKDKEKLIITFLPSNVYKDTKTRFTIARGSMDLEKVNPENNLIPKIGDKPKKEIAPVYPGASLMALSEDVNFQQAQYAVEDDINKVIDFYKAKMPNYAWILAKEFPIQRTTYDKQKIDFSKYSPDCPVITDSTKMPQGEKAELIFSKNNGETCKIVFFRMIPGRSPGVGSNGRTFDYGNFTVMVVQYEKK